MTLDIIKTVGILSNVVQSCTKSEVKGIEKLWVTYTKINGSDEEKKIAVDQCFINQLHDLVKSNSSLDSIFQMFNIIIQAVEKDLCSSLTLFIGLTDVLDVLTLCDCDSMFAFIEERVDVWKSEIFYNSGKNYLLRMCNDLLRRLSKSQNTIFCGRIQLFLARLFPLEERSGLNLMSQFNLENMTTYCKKPEDSLKSEMEMETSVDESKSPIDYNLYSKLWLLQDFFRKPTQCYEKTLWLSFINSTEVVLSCFKSYKLDNEAYSRKHVDPASAKTVTLTKDSEMNNGESDNANSTYFAKYLTSEKLLDLQLSDSNFRRNILIQFLIVFQYLTAPVKSKTSSQVLNEEQISLVSNLTKQVYQLLEETPPNGPAFLAVIQHIITREENWNSWKNEGCLNYIRKKDDPKNKHVVMPKLKKRSMVADMRHPSTAKVMKMGNAELTRLWNIQSDSGARNFVPAMDKFFEEAVIQLDSKSGVEEQYKLVNDPTFSWKALRLMSRSHPLFFSQQPQVSMAPNSVQPPKTTAQFLESIIGKIAKDGSNNIQQQVQCVVDKKKPDFNNEVSTKQTNSDMSSYEEGLNDDTVANDDQDDVEESADMEEQSEGEEEEGLPAAEV